MTPLGRSEGIGQVSSFHKVKAQGSYGDGIGAGAGIGGGFDGSAGTFTMNGSGVVFNNLISDISQKIVASWLLGTGALSLAMSIWTKR